MTDFEVTLQIWTWSIAGHTKHTWRGPFYNLYAKWSVKNLACNWEDYIEQYTTLESMLTFQSKDAVVYAVMATFSRGMWGCHDHFHEGFRVFIPQSQKVTKDVGCKLQNNQHHIPNYNNQND